MKKVKKKYIGKVKNGLLARCPTCKTKGYTKKELIIKERKYNSLKEDNIVRTDYILQKVPCKECNGKGVILWIDRIIRKEK
jgi:hypothetical protein